MAKNPALIQHTDFGASHHIHEFYVQTAVLLLNKQRYNHAPV